MYSEDLPRDLPSHPRFTKPPIIDFENQLQKKSFFCIEMDVID
ncbi:hypothetical protein C427_0818 [Paraglaciecola psychrophila 170]|uniref:Uncharacterized protein n=1 Tax=Paraglaciecola psychrophila 170 TaxID=1129794 RepID=M4RWS7_9ALTE|nr:hypothetical protein C427_0818 [Paraglaciecola psychrophila 170]